MRHTWRVTLSWCTHLIASSRTVRRRHSPLLHTLMFLCMTHFLYSWLETLDCTLSKTNFLTLPHSPVFENSPYRQLILINDAYSRWSTGNRGRATSASEVIEVAGSNHAIGVILNLAWGPNNFSPSMIWSWRTRSNSQTGLGAEQLLPVEFALFYVLFFTLFSFLYERSFFLDYCDIFGYGFGTSRLLFSLFIEIKSNILISVYFIIIIEASYSFFFKVLHLI